MPLQFTFLPPGLIVFGHEARLKAGTLLHQRGCGGRVMLVHDDGDWCKESLAGIASGMTDCGMSMHAYAHTAPTVTGADVEKARAFARRKKVTALVAVGGMAVMDVAKAVAIGFDCPPAISEIHATDESPPKRILLLFAVPDTSGIENALSHAIVLSGGDSEQERRLWNAGLTADAVIIDPCMMEGMRREDVLASAMGVMAQCIDKYTGVAYSPLADALLLEAIHLIAENCRAVWTSGAVRAENILAARAMAAVAANASPHTATTALARALETMERDDRSIAAALALPFVVKARVKSEPRRVARVGENLGIPLPDDATPEEIGALVAGELAHLNNSVGIVGFGACPNDDALLETMAASLGEPTLDAASPDAETEALRRSLVSMASTRTSRIACVDEGFGPSER